MIKSKLTQINSHNFNIKKKDQTLFSLKTLRPKGQKKIRMNKNETKE